MRVAVAGATGAIGVPLVRELVERGHEVLGLTRSESNRGVIERLGARAAVADVMDQESLRGPIEAFAPEWVANMTTALPKRGPWRVSELRATNELRRRGTRPLIEAAVAAGAKRMVVESIAFIYDYMRAGDAPLTEESPVAVPIPAVGDGWEAAMARERAVLAASAEGRIEGIVLRFGFFYGPGPGSTDFMVKMLRRRMLRIPGDGAGIVPPIHVEDAATAVIAAFERGRPGEVYNVVDDRPVTTAEFMREAARALGAAEPKRAPVWLMRLVAPYLAFGATQAKLRVSNAKARRELGWEPRYPTYREGLATVAEVDGARSAG